jgi:putative tricarboxylic transport membrane protein
MIDSLFQGFLSIMTVTNILYIGSGIVIGILVGAIPGLSATMAIALFVPVTFYIDPITSISFLIGIYKGGIYGASIPAILINTPGAAGACATVFDGFPLTQQGKAGKALKMSIYASVFGDSFSDIVVIFVAAHIAGVALKFGSAEYASLLLFALTIIGAVSGKSITKGIIAAALGMFVSTVGMDPLTGRSRFSFGSVELMGGLGLVSMFIGMFALPEIMIQLEEKEKTNLISKLDRARNPDDDRCTWRDFKSCFPAILRSSVIGTVIGALPGLGQSIAAFIGYSEAKRTAKNPENYGKGELRGVAAAEAANNAVDGATLIPLLTLGIPGDAITAILLGAFMIQGLVPGPTFIQDNGPLIYAIFVGMLLANLLMLAIALGGIRFFAKVPNIPVNTLFPMVFIFCVIGAYAINSSLFDVGVMLGFGLLAYAMRKLEFPVAPFVIAFFIGPLFEAHLRRALLGSKGDFTIFFTRPISLAFVCLALISVFWALKKRPSNTP